MKCFVPVKRVIDFNVKVQVKSDESEIETDHVKTIKSLDPIRVMTMRSTAFATSPASENQAVIEKLSFDKKSLPKWWGIYSRFYPHWIRSWLPESDRV